MTMSVDLVVRRGTIADGSGNELFEGDLAIKGDRIVAVDPGRLSVSATEEIDAKGLLVTPGFVDIHTHYDGNITWEDRIRPSCAHGVTTIVTGNCGVGFAPCRLADRDRLIALMAGVEDIPEIVMAEGLPWNWETFPEFMDAVEQRPRDMNVGVQVPHSALRVYVMGQRAIDREPATEDDIRAMARITREAMRAGALGFATSRALHQRSSAGESIPSVRALEDELLGIALALKASGSGVLQLISDFALYQDVPGEFGLLRRLVEQSGRPLSYTLHQYHNDPEGWRTLLRLTAEAAEEGLPIKGQVSCRPTGVLLGHELSMSPFLGCPSYDALAPLRFSERINELKKAETRARILGEFASPPSGAAAAMERVLRDFTNMFVLGDPPVYEPAPETSIAATALRRGMPAADYAYECLLANEGRALLLQTAQDYAYGTSDVTREMLMHGDTVIGLGDGGAHCGILCDASWPTYMLTHWARDRSRGARLPLSWVVKAQTHDTASAVGLNDRGLIRPGYKADLNIIDFDRLQLRIPEVTYDLPKSGRRVIQRAEGYVATIVNGIPVYVEGGKPTGALPGRLVRGAQATPASP